MREPQEFRPSPNGPRQQDRYLGSRHVNQLAYLIFDFSYSREIDIVLLDDARVQTIEVHDEDVFVPESTFGLKHKTAFVLILLAFSGFSASAFVVIVVLILDSGFGFLSPRLVRTDVL